MISPVNLFLYAVQILISSKSSKISAFVIAKDEIPHTRAEYYAKTASNQPHLLGLPVVVPNSPPTFLIVSPVSSSNSVTKGPSPTLVT